ncbi:hypothetical protein M6D81_12370 [Paenibacillus sp. J5C_2022]|uniref:hypothetical protein n=1 Tax=Paenibacillus sp. J5C2022 TaxID=2977129 RepID=UPI0021CE1B4C|nr:hypothetical protein [Paenibacillus sp. J5C2022]MCU6709499.1 hypothetical protein [Paenibacillus sp. J5C2022]
MREEDALFNWLQIRVVADARPEDEAARKTLEFFLDVLSEDHAITSAEISRTDDTMIYVKYEKNGKSKLQLIPREAGEQLLLDINANPKFN